MRRGRSLLDREALEEGGEPPHLRVAVAAHRLGDPEPFEELACPRVEGRPRGERAQRAEPVDRCPGARGQLPHHGPLAGIQIVEAVEQERSFRIGRDGLRDEIAHGHRVAGAAQLVIGGEDPSRHGHRDAVLRGGHRLHLVGRRRDALLEEVLEEAGHGVRGLRVAAEVVQRLARTGLLQGGEGEEGPVRVADGPGLEGEGTDLLRETGHAREEPDPAQDGGAEHRDGDPAEALELARVGRHHGDPSGLPGQGPDQGGEPSLERPVMPLEQPRDPGSPAPLHAPSHEVALRSYTRWVFHPAYYHRTPPPAGARSGP